MKSSKRKSMSPLLLESICVKEGRALLLPFHQIRVDASLARLQALAPRARCSPMPKLCLTDFVEKLSLPKHNCYKLRLVYDAKGCVNQCCCEPYEIRSIERFVLRDLPDLDYSLKWADRSVLEPAIRGLCSKEEPLICQSGWLCDASYANLLFGAPGNWTTPSHYLLAGVKRASLLASGDIKQAAIHKDSLDKYPYICLINAMMDPEELMFPMHDVLQSLSIT